MNSYGYPKDTGKRLKSLSSFEIRARHGCILTDVINPRRGYACGYMHSSHTGGMHTLMMRWHVYALDAHYAWSHAFRPAYGRE